MVDNKEYPSLFSSFKDVMQKVQQDVSTGIELMKYRNQQSGLRRQEENLFNELGRNIYNAHKSKKNTAGIIEEYYNKVEDIEKEIAALQRKINKLEKQNVPDTKKASSQEAKPKETAKPAATKDKTAKAEPEKQEEDSKKEPE